MLRRLPTCERASFARAPSEVGAVLLKSIHRLRTKLSAVAAFDHTENHRRLLIGSGYQVAEEEGDRGSGKQDPQFGEEEVHAHTLRSEEPRSGGVDILPLRSGPSGPARGET